MLVRYGSTLWPHEHNYKASTTKETPMNLIKSNIKTMSSIELLSLINESRIEFGEPEIRRNKLSEKIEDELEGENYTKSVVQNLNNTESTVYHLTVEQCTLVGMRESKAVRRSVMTKLKELETETPKPMTQLEVLAGLTSAMVDQERKQLEQAETLAAVEIKLEEVEAKVQSQVWEECPVNALSISSIRQIINDKYSIPSWAVDEIVRGGYGPRPAGQVRNSHESANGRTYTVYWLSDITKLFSRIVRDAEPVTATLCTHDFVSKRFKLVEA